MLLLFEEREMRGSNVRRGRDGEENRGESERLGESNRERLSLDSGRGR